MGYFGGSRELEFVLSRRLVFGGDGMGQEK
jgi:hypothetical protein